jgi:hypothetical protein
MSIDSYTDGEYEELAEQIAIQARQIADALFEVYEPFVSLVNQFLNGVTEWYIECQRIQLEQQLSRYMPKLLAQRLAQYCPADMLPPLDLTSEVPE